MYLTQGLHRAVACQPDTIATICGERRQTYRVLGDRVARLAGGLRALGLSAGDRVAMLSHNSDHYVEYLLGTYWGDFVVNPVNTRWSAAEIAYSLDDCDTTVLIVDDAFLPMAADLLKRSMALETIIYAGDRALPDGMMSFERIIAETAPVEDAYRSGKDLAGVFYTGGTTGFPKGVMLSHENLYLNALTSIAEGIVERGMIGLHAAPMFHLADGAFMNALTLAGATHVMIPSFTPVSALESIELEKVSVVVLVPTMVQMMIDHPDVARYDLSSLKTVIYGASPISEAVIDRAMSRLPHADFYQGYGMTELSALATILRPEYHTPEGRAGNRLRSGGQPVLCAEVRIVDPVGKEVERGTLGEIIVRSTGVMLGYWGKPDETSAAVRDGWMHTGDAGRMDAEGFVFVVDRIKDMIVTGAENVYSAEVENAVLQHRAVAACAVIGVPDERWGERVHAVVVLRPGAEASDVDLKAHCQQLIANYKCPRSFEFVDSLPLSGAGKVLKTELRKPYWAGHDRSVA